MGTPCRCCGKVICKSEEIRFDHDRYNYNGSIAFIHLVQTISYNIDGGGYQQQSREEYFFQDTEPTACNFTVEKEEALEGANPPVMVKTETSIVRKFALRYSINDVYDWGESNMADHDFINSIFIRAGESDAKFKRDVPVGPVDVPGLGADPQANAKGGLYIASGRNIDLQSMQDWNNLASGKPSYDFDHIDQDEIFIEKEDINENNEYYILVECPESETIVKWGRWFDGDVTKRAFIELRRITGIGTRDSSREPTAESCRALPVLQDHTISGKEDLDDWHTLFTRTADGTYVSNNIYMDKELNFGDFFSFYNSNWGTAGGIPSEFFAFCGELQVGFLNPDGGFYGGTYLDLLYKIDYDRQADYAMPIDFPAGCSGSDDERFTSDSVSVEFIDPLNPFNAQDQDGNLLNPITITKSKSELGEAPTDIFSTSSSDRVGDYVTELYEFTPPHNNNVLRFKYNVVGGEDRFNGADYIITEAIADYSDCKDIKVLKFQGRYENQFDNEWRDLDPLDPKIFSPTRCPVGSDYFKISDTYDEGRLKKPLIQKYGHINGIIIRPCVIESSKAVILSDGPERRMSDTDIIKSYNYVPHYGEYEPALIRFIIRNHEFYPFKLKINDINDACPKECLPTEHIPEWQLLESSFSCAGSPAIINEMIYGSNGGLALNNSADVFACCTKLSSDRQLMSCRGKYSINTSYAMRVANYVASKPSVWDLRGQGEPTYPRCSEFDRAEDQLSFPNVHPGCNLIFPNRDIIHIGTDDVCYDGSLRGGADLFGFGQQIMKVCHTLQYMDYTSLFPSFVTPHSSDGWNVRFVGDDEGRPVTYVGSAGYYSIRGLYSENDYSVPSLVPFSERRRAGSNRDIYGTVASHAKEYSTGQLEYKKTCLEKSLDVEGYEIENEFAEEHNICILEVSAGTTFSLDKEIQKNKSDGFNTRQQSDVVLQDPDCGEGLRWRVNTDDVGVFEALFDYDEDEDVSHACYFYERDDLDLVYQEYVPVITFPQGKEAAAKIRAIAVCVGKYLATLAADEQFDYWYKLGNDVTLSLQPEDDGYSKTEIRSDEAGIQVLEIHKEVGDLVEVGEKVFTMKTSDINIRNQFGSGTVSTILKQVGDIVSAGDLIMKTRFGDSIRSVLAPEDGEITAINVAKDEQIFINNILAVMMTKKTIVSPVKGAIDSIDVEVGDVVFRTQLMASVVSTADFPKGSYIKVMPDGKFDGPFENHSIFKNENHYEVKDEVKIEVDGVWAKGKPAEGKRNILADNAGIPSDITHEGEDGYKFTFYTSGIPSAYAYDYGVKDDKGVELGDSPSEFFSDEFIPVFDELHGRFREKPPLTEDEAFGRDAGECGLYDTHVDFGDDVFETANNNPFWCSVFGSAAAIFGVNKLPPCGYITERTITKGDYYKTAPGNIVQGTTSVTVEAPQSDMPDSDGKASPRNVVFRCYDPPTQNQGVNSTCRNGQGDLHFCDPCETGFFLRYGGGDINCTYHETICPSNYEFRQAGFDSGRGLWMTVNGPSQTLEFATSSRQATEGGWDYKYDIGDNADASYGETETYRCITEFATLNTYDGIYLSGCFGGGTFSSVGNFDMDGVEINGSCLVPTDDETPCPDGTDEETEDKRNANFGSEITAVYRKIVLKSEFNKCGDDRLPNLNYSDKDLVYTGSGDKKSFPQAVITKSVALSQHEQSLDDHDITEEQKEKINDKLSELDQKIMRGEIDAPENVFSSSVEDLCGTGKKFRIERDKGEVLAGDTSKSNVRCRPENYVPNLHAEKFGVVVDHGDKVQAFYDAVSDAGLSAPKDFPCGRKESQAEKILNDYMYGSNNNRCADSIGGAFRFTDTFGGGLR